MKKFLFKSFIHRYSKVKKLSPSLTLTDLLRFFYDEPDQDIVCAHVLKTIEAFMSSADSQILIEHTPTRMPNYEIIEEDERQVFFSNVDLEFLEI